MYHTKIIKNIDILIKNVKNNNEENHIIYFKKETNWNKIKKIQIQFCVSIILKFVINRIIIVVFF